MRTKRLVLLAFLITLYIGPVLFISSYGPSATPTEQNLEKDFARSAVDPWLTGWSYRKQLSFTGETGAGTNYQVEVILSSYDYSGPIDFEYVSDVGPYNASQSVAVNGSHFWTTSGGSGAPALNFYLSGYDSSWHQFVGRDCDGDGPASKKQINGVQEKDGVLYVTANNWTDGTEPPRGWVLEYDPDTLAYSTYHTLDNSSSLPHEHFAEGLDWNNGYWWVVWHDWPYITKYDVSWNWVADYELTFTGNGHYYQGIMWYGDYVYVNIHSSGDPTVLDCFLWNGTGFEEVKRMTQVTATCSQGMSLDKTDNLTVYWANRGGADDMKVTISTISPDYISLEGHAQTDFDDVRFTDDDEITQLDYWRADVTDGRYSRFWVEVADDLDSNQVIYVYYGNSTVSTTSNGTATFPVFDDFNRADNATVGGDWTDNAGSGDNDIYNNTLRVAQKQHYYSHVEQSGGSLTKFAFEAKIKCYNDTGGTWHPSLFVYWSPYEWLSVGPRMDGNDKHHGYTNDGGSNTNHYGVNSSFDSWYYYKVMIDTNVHVQSSPDGYNWTDVYDISRSTNWSGAPSLVVLGKGFSINAGSYPNADLDNDGGVAGDSNQISYYDDTFIRKCLETEVALSTVGDEDHIREWNVINDPVVIFSVAFDTWSFDILLLFLGLVIIPLSTLYLAYGGKNNMSTDKLLYGLLAFVMGWGLFIGGIVILGG